MLHLSIHFNITSKELIWSSIFANDYIYFYKEEEVVSLIKISVAMNGFFIIISYSFFSEISIF
jgi:hypothetical protein